MDFQNTYLEQIAQQFPRLAELSKPVFWQGDIWFLAKYLSSTVGLKKHHASLHFRRLQSDDVLLLNFNEAHKFRNLFHANYNISLSIMEDYILVHQRAAAAYLYQFLNLDDLDPPSDVTPARFTYFFDDLDIIAIKNNDTNVVASLPEYSDLFPESSVRVLLKCSHHSPEHTLLSIANRPLSPDELNYY